MRYSIIIPTCNRPEDIKKTLATIISQTLTPFEIIIVDQSDNQETYEIISDMQKNPCCDKTTFFYLYQNEKNSAKARNVGICKATGEIISFLDDDVLLLNDYFERVICYFSCHRDVQGISGKVIIENENVDGLKSRMVRKLAQIFLINNYNGKMTVSGFGYPISEGHPAGYVEVELFAGCNMNFRSTCFKVERFDEWFTGYSFREDVELSYRISRMNKLMMIPDAKLYHMCSASNRMSIEKRKLMEFVNYGYVFRKHMKKNFFSLLLFLYSLCGIVCLDFIQFSWSLKWEKWAVFVAGLKGVLVYLFCFFGKESNSLKQKHCFKKV